MPDTRPARRGVFRPGCEPWAEIFGELLIDLAAQALRQCWALACGGDGDLQISATHHRAEIEIAVGRIVDCIAENAALYRGCIDGVIHCRSFGSGDDEECAFEIRRIEFAAVPGDLPDAASAWISGRASGAMTSNERIRLQQALNFLEPQCCRRR